VAVFAADEIKLSICTPGYNRARFLEKSPWTPRMGWNGF
jgi:hypothetical protein